ncbi:hypothetical protein [Streptacidiphilus monticola]|jgi:hypothetical protein|uniref:Uncharacterized protein n=1 Tax=Streptacidiphilus monticola TaxID=2161674 RepID=A0ABW1G8Z8_9ACTN
MTTIPIRPALGRELGTAWHELNRCWQEPATVTTVQDMLTALQRMTELVEQIAAELEADALP